MKVKDLIELLKKHDPEMIVLIESDDRDGDTLFEHIQIVAPLDLMTRDEDSRYDYFSAKRFEQTFQYAGEPDEVKHRHWNIRRTCLCIGRNGIEEPPQW